MKACEGDGIFKHLSKKSRIPLLKGHAIIALARCKVITPGRLVGQTPAKVQHKKARALAQHARLSAFGSRYSGTLLPRSWFRAVRRPLCAGNAGRVAGLSYDRRSSAESDPAAGQQFGLRRLWVWAKQSGMPLGGWRWRSLGREGQSAWRRHRGVSSAAVKSLRSTSGSTRFSR